LDTDQSLDDNDSIKLLIVRQMVKAITGQDFKLYSPAELSSDAENTAIEITTTPPPAKQPSSAGFGLVYEHHAIYQESESASFSAVGSIQTQDGQSIDFSVKLKMGREFRLETNLAIGAGNPEKKVDPLVINFGGNAAGNCRKRALNSISTPTAPLNKSLY
jgi:hypothetical protein